MSALADFFRIQLVNLRQRALRAMPGPMLVRLAVWFSALAGYFLAFPADVVFNLRAALGLTVLALLPALYPRGGLVTATVLIAVVGWLMATSAYQEPLTAWRLVALAGALYLLHTGAALAAVLPYDTVVSPGVLGRWLIRAAGVITVSGAFGVLALNAAEALAGRTFVVASVAGVALTALFVWVLALRK